MGEIDTKPIEPVQVALSLFGEKSDQRKSWCTSSDRECENKKEHEELLKDLANYKVQLEAKDTAYKQALLKLEQHQKSADELSIVLKNTEIERDILIHECGEARTRVGELDSKIKEKDDQLLETIKTREQLTHALSELKATQGELLSMETELALARDSNREAMTQAELMETAANMEKEKTQELLRRVSELTEAIAMSRLAAVEAEKEKLSLLSEKDAEIELATAAAVQAQVTLEDMIKQVKMMDELENQLMTKSVFIDMLQLQLKQANELLSSSEKTASDAIKDLNELQADLEVKERKSLDRSAYIEALEMELNQLKLELHNSKEEACRLNCVAETLTRELLEVKTNMDEIRSRETKAEIEVALLKAELHKGKSKIAAAEAAEARAESVKSGLYLAVQQLAVEAQEAKKENQGDHLAEEAENSVLVNFQSERAFQDVEPSQIDELKTEEEGKRDEDDSHITISLKEYESLIKKAEKANYMHVVVGENAGQLTLHENKYELENLKKELEVAMVKVGEFRTRAEQAVSRAELAEKAKLAIEDQLRRWREHKQRRKAALAALREESAPKEFYPPQYDRPPTTYQPLGKVLNMEF
ncbi:hypothetical protein F2P56_003765 [Juglans regia]|uniref:Protein WEAK CHLOROPLAST MOVEMENT UNDER BLUE LIGHT-like 1 n=2 Tax=Juglans regia TaxID=51240 RepID=A0A2I4GTE5_JUGRE|nr:protein WEAK CHLOROPLAST MOVEMENT UNDER BLUE LIGHT-like 1 [Juglans regia]KAF5477087.1 hypothetical protein F2P56_003765 [Juglans regia]